MEMIYTYLGSLDCEVSENIWLCGPMFKTLEAVDYFLPAHSGLRCPLVMNVKYPGLCSFKIYLVMGLHVQNPMSSIRVTEKKIDRPMFLLVLLRGNPH